MDIDHASVDLIVLRGVVMVDGFLDDKGGLAMGTDGGVVSVVDLYGSTALGTDGRYDGHIGSLLDDKLVLRG